MMSFPGDDKDDDYDDDDDADAAYVQLLAFHRVSF